MKRLGHDEERLAGGLVAWLREQRWEVYQEVQVSTGGPRADVVATQGPVLWAIEVKASLGLAVLEQAEGWIGHANYVSVATPTTRRRSFIGRIASDLGIGILSIGDINGDGRDWRVSECERPRLCRRTTGRLRGALREEHKTFAPAGNATSSYWSPWKATCREVASFTRAHSGCTLKELVTGIRHHYSSTATARSSLAKWIEGGHVEGVRLERDGRLLRVFPTAEGPAA